MRLFHSEHHSLLSAISAYGYREAEVRLWKKSGWVHLQISNREPIFAFHRKKISRIVKGKFQDYYQYSVRVNNKVLPMKDWDEVLREFDSLLLKIEGG